MPQYVSVTTGTNGALNSPNVFFNRLYQIFIKARLSVEILHIEWGCTQVYSDVYKLAVPRCTLLKKALFENLITNDHDVDENSG